MRTRHCAGCGHQASGGARFCERCGATLTRAARPLRSPRSLEAQILGRRTSIEGERKQVTVMYVDIVGSMALTRALDNERWGFLLDRVLAMAADAVHAFEGTVNQFTGDGLLAVFGAPLAHEDHARRACLAVLDLQREAAVLTAELARTEGVQFAIRCGLNSGEVLIGAIGDDVHMDFVPIGNTTALGKRIESLAPPGSTAISAPTAALVEGEFEVRELGTFDLKGDASPQRLFELIGVGPARTRLEAVAATRGLSPFVGRAEETAQLYAALEAALAGDGRVVDVVGDAGVGKSRLVHEFVSGCVARGLHVASAGGMAHGRYVPLLPVIALYRDWFGIADRDPPEAARERISGAMLAMDPAFAGDLPLLLEFLGIADPEQRPARMDPATRRQRLLAAATHALTRSRREPAVLVIEDLHWVDDATDAFLEALVDAVAGTRVLLVCTQRPGHEAPWAAEGPRVQLDLAPLDPGATGDLLTGLLGDDPSLEGLAELIEARGTGNPFFIEELVVALAETGHLTGSRGAYRLDAGLDELVLPATVQAGLAARIDRLPAREKALVQAMSVIGVDVPGPVLSEVAPLAGPELAEAIEMLSRANWVVPQASAGAPGYAFRHPLTQEVAYTSQLSSPRAHAHRMVAAAIERVYPDGLDERAALLAHHCEAAGDTLEAAGWHARAAAWSEVASPADAMRHWRRVRELAGRLDTSPEREALATRARTGLLGLAWRLGMSSEEVMALYAEAHEDGEHFLLDLYYAGSLMHSAREREGLDGFLGASRAAPDAGSALTASVGVAYASWIAGSLPEGIEAVDRALGPAGDDPGIGTGLAFVCPLAHAIGQRGHCVGYTGALDDARDSFERAIALAREHEDAETLSATYANRALFQAETGDVEGALRHAALSLAISEPAGNAVHIIVGAAPEVVAKAAAGRPADALEQAGSLLDRIRELGIARFYEPLLLATIARCELELGRHEEALAAAEEGARIAEARGLATCGLTAPLALAQVLAATRTTNAAERARAVLTSALAVARESHARVYEVQIEDQLATLAVEHPELDGRDRVTGVPSPP